MARAKASPRHGPRGLTLVEIVIVLIIIAILTAALAPIVLAQVERARVSAERKSIAGLADAFRRFRHDTGYWPYGTGYWDMSNQVDPAPFTVNDTALFMLPATAPPGLTHTLSTCIPGSGGPTDDTGGVLCWDGPYISANTEANGTTPAAFIDTWGNPRMYALVRPNDGLGGGTPGAPQGFVAVWSVGPDGVDSAGCYNGGGNSGCVRDLDRLARGLPSMTTASNGGPADDIIVVAGTAE